MTFLKPNQTVLSVMAFGVFVIIFITDIVTPIGYSHWILYIIPLLIVYLTENNIMTYILLAITVPALILGYIESPLLQSYENIHIISLVNRALGFVVFLSFTIIINKLIQAQKHYRILVSELAYANKELESFSYSAAHDLKAPLGIMKSFGQILIDDYSENLDSQGVEYLRKIIENSAKMTNLIEDMLNLSKISLRNVDTQEVDISEIAEAIFAELKTSAPERNVEVHIDGGMKARADNNLIRIALKNLIGNAWKYTSKKELAVISITAKYTRSETIFCIKDNGCGFDMKFAKNLFLPFKRLHSESEFKGTGIGLSIVDRVIRRHNGRIWAESELNQGAEFYFTLPR